jgi:hypothetical protein
VIVSHDGAIEPRDQLQARVVERLRAARGAPVSFDELRAMGIENPALLGYELAAAGLPIEQARESGGRALTLDPRAEHHSGERPDLGPAGAAEGSAPSDASPAGLRSRLNQLPRSHRHIRGVLTQRLRPLIRVSVRHLSPRPGFAVRRPSRAGIAVAAALTIVVAALLALTLSARPARRTRLSADQPRGRLTRPLGPSAGHYAQQSTSARSDSTKRAGPGELAGGQPSVAVSPVVAASLEATGHELLLQGRYEQAISELRDAVQASGGSVARCAEPTSEACLTFAYALYDLGSALRLEGDPQAAIPVLSERLQIDNQRTVVEEQLDLARAGVV